jgi:hypothetical protein
LNSCLGGIGLTKEEIKNVIRMSANLNRDCEFSKTLAVLYEMGNSSLKQDVVDYNDFIELSTSVSQEIARIYVRYRQLEEMFADVPDC